MRKTNTVFSVILEAEAIRYPIANGEALERDSHR